MIDFKKECLEWQEKKAAEDHDEAVREGILAYIRRGAAEACGFPKGYVSGLGLQTSEVIELVKHLSHKYNVAFNGSMAEWDSKESGARYTKLYAYISDCIKEGKTP